MQGATQVGTVVRWETTGVSLEWQSADWAPDDDRTELEIRQERGGIRVEHRGFGEQFWDPGEIVGWFADEVAAPLLLVSAPARYGDWLTDRGARRPFGIRARRDYKDPTHHRPSFGAVLSALNLQSDDVLLELGAGGGAFIEQALRSGCRAVGLDHSQEMVRAASELNEQAIDEGRLEVVLGDAHDLPFVDAAFDAAVIQAVLEHVVDPQRVVAELHRVLREDGVLYSEVPFMQQVHEGAYDFTRYTDLGHRRRVLKPSGRLAVFTVSAEAKGTPAAPEPMASRGHFHTDEELVEMAREAGFRLASVEHPALEPHARAAGLPDDVVALFSDTSSIDQLLLARR